MMNRNNNIVFQITLLFLSIQILSATDYYVNNSHPQASNSNPGTSQQPWATIQYAANNLQAGDNCFVMSGTYNERVTIGVSGSAGNYITFSAIGDVVVRGFVINTRSYIRIAGFEVTQNSTFQSDGIFMQNSDHCQILSNNIHHVEGVGIFLHKNSPSNYTIIRDNVMSFIGSLPGNEVGEIAIHIAGNYNIVEYNEISHVADFTNVWGEYNIVRNNYFHDCYLSDYPDFPNADGHHIDGLQYYSASLTLDRTLVEANYVKDVSVPHAHVIILRDIYNNGSHEMIFRKNHALRNGSYGAFVDYFDNFRFYNNTYVDILDLHPVKANYCIQFTHGALNGRVINNVFYNSASSNGMLYYVDGESQSGFFADYNLAFLSGRPSEPNGILNIDPQFLNYSNDLNQLQSTSPAIDAGGGVTTTSNSGSGTSVTVRDAGYFMDGWGIVRGDLIRIGSSEPVRVTNINYATNQLTVDRSISWNNNDPVSLTYQGNSPDMGAFEYLSNGYEFDIEITSPADQSGIGGSVEIRTNLTNESVVRFVIFYVNEIPMAQVHSSPYHFNWDTSNINEGSYTVEARAYALNAESVLTQSDIINVFIGDFVTTPNNIRIKK